MPLNVSNARVDIGKDICGQEKTSLGSLTRIYTRFSLALPRKPQYMSSDFTVMCRRAGVVFPSTILRTLGCVCLFVRTPVSWHIGLKTNKKGYILVYLFIGYMVALGDTRAYTVIVTVLV